MMKLSVRCPARHPGHETGHLCMKKYPHDDNHRCECGSDWRSPDAPNKAVFDGSVLAPDDRLLARWGADSR